MFHTIEFRKCGAFDKNLSHAAIANHREQATTGVLELAQVAEGTHLTAAIKAISKKEKRAGNLASYWLVELT